MTAPTRLVLVTAAALALPSPIGAQSAGEPPRASLAPAFSGRYQLVLTVGRGCPAAVQVGPLSVAVDVAEAAVTAGSEVSGASASPSEIPDNGRFVLLRQGDRLHGAFGASTIELGLNSREGRYRIWMQIMTDGTAATSSGGRARASGTAFGYVELSSSSDPTGEPEGYCDALDHQWSLEPM